MLSSTLITRGLVRYGEPKPVVLPQSALKTAASVVTAAPVKGSVLKEGSSALEIGGRPVLVLQGGLPTYRDLRPGDAGTDVQQLEDALRRLGFDPGPADGSYDAKTQAAVERWFRAAGYDAFEPTEAQKQQLRTSRETAARAHDSVLTAQRSVDQARSPDKKLQANENAAAAQDRVATADETQHAKSRGLSSSALAGNLPYARRLHQH